MKVLLNGATSGTNFGDFIFAKMFQEKLIQLVGKNNVYWYKSRYALSDFYANHLGYHQNYRLSNIDALVFISGGYFHGDDHCLKDYIIRYLRYFHVGICCLFHKIPFAIIAVEVGPTKNCVLRFVEKVILKHAKIVVVRNRESEYYASLMGAKQIICTADTVFAMERSLFVDITIPIEIETCEKRKLFLHINPTIEGNHDIIQKIVPIVNEFCSRHPEYAIVIGTDQYTNKQNDVFEFVRSQLKVSTIFLNEYNYPLELCKVLEQCDVIVTHKLHVGIVGAYLSKSVVSFSGHTSKIERLYKQLNILERTTPLASLTLEKGLAIMEQNHNRPIRVPKNITNSAKQNLKYLADFIEQIRQGNIV